VRLPLLAAAGLLGLALAAMMMTVLGIHSGDTYLGPPDPNVAALPTPTATATAASPFAVYSPPANPPAAAQPAAATTTTTAPPPPPTPATPPPAPQPKPKHR
jgi:hypothetical protein